MDIPEIPYITIIYRERKDNSDGFDAPHPDAGLTLKIKTMITDQRLLVAAFHAADLRHGGKVSRGFISVCTPWYTGSKVSVHHKDKFSGQRSSVTHTASSQSRKERAYIDRGSG